MRDGAVKARTTDINILSAIVSIEQKGDGNRMARTLARLAKQQNPDRKVLLLLLLFVLSGLSVCGVSLKGTSLRNQLCPVVKSFP